MSVALGQVRYAVASWMRRSWFDCFVGVSCSCLAALTCCFRVACKMLCTQHIIRVCIEKEGPRVMVALYITPALFRGRQSHDTAHCFRIPVAPCRGVVVICIYIYGVRRKSGSSRLLRAAVGKGIGHRKDAAASE